MLTKNALGNTGLEVTRLGYGAMNIRNDGQWASEDIGWVEELLHGVLDAGINFIDTSPDYGHSEEYIGRFLGSRRKEFYIATKCGCAENPDIPWYHIWTRDQVRMNIENSLKAMQTDYVDLLQLHSPMTLAKMQQMPLDMDEMATVLQELKYEGLVRHIGISEEPPYLDRALDMGVFDTFQLPYSALNMDSHDFIRQAGEARCGVIIRGGIAQGLYSDDWKKAWQGSGLAAIAEAEKIETHEFILRFTLSHPHMHTTIVGTTKVAHLQQNLEAAQKGPLPDHVLRQCHGLLQTA